MLFFKRGLCLCVCVSFKNLKQLAGLADIVRILLYRCHMNVVYNYFDPLRSYYNRNHSRSQIRSRYNHIRIRSLMPNYLDRHECRSMGQLLIAHYLSIGSANRYRGRSHQCRPCCLVDLATMPNLPNRQPSNCIANCRSCCNHRLCIWKYWNYSRNSNMVSFLFGELTEVTSVAYSEAIANMVTVSHYDRIQNANKKTLCSTVCCEIVVCLTCLLWIVVRPLWWWSLWRCTPSLVRVWCARVAIAISLLLWRCGPVLVAGHHVRCAHRHVHLRTVHLSVWTLHHSFIFAILVDERKSQGEEEKYHKN